MSYGVTSLRRARMFVTKGRHENCCPACRAATRRTGILGIGVQGFVRRWRASPPANLVASQRDNCGWAAFGF